MLPTPRRLVATVVLATVALGAAGCSSAGSSASSDALTFWAYEPNSKAQKASLEELIAGFEDANDVDVKVTYVPKDGFNTKLNSSIAVDRNPDVSYLDQPLIAKFAEDGILLDLTDQLAAGIGSDSFYPGAMDTATVDGTVYGLPISMTTVALAYNKALVDEAPTTWDEWLASAKDVYVKDTIAAFEGIGSGSYSGWVFPALVQSAGGSMVNADQTAVTFAEQPGIDAAELLVELQTYSDQAVRESQNAFGNGLVAYKIAGPWDVESLTTDFPDLDFGVAEIPAEKGHESSSTMGGENLVVYANSTKQELAYEFAQYLTDAEGDAVMAGVTGNFAANVAAAESLGYASDPELGVFTTQLETAVARPTLTDWLKVNDEVIGAALDSILVSGEDPTTVLTKAAADADEILFG
ncbi:MAG: ABC transporter substrate-binding protein [Microbacteriaceae bacterium]